MGTLTEALTYDAVHLTSGEVAGLIFPTDGDFIVKVSPRTHSIETALCATSRVDVNRFCSFSFDIALSQGKTRSKLAHGSN